jgi:hypothetical protein
MGIKRGKYIYEDGYAVASDHREDEDEGYRQEEVTNIRGGETDPVGADARGGQFPTKWLLLGAAILVIAFALLWTLLR